MPTTRRENKSITPGIWAGRGKMRLQKIRRHHVLFPRWTITVDPRLTTLQAAFLH
ncbi:hypothetical protein XNC1_3234 [Xenorhabdus nematophila ATCC 19061]|uniref:Uncharacterized protein n=1 Tax=Xenorhabdus nematophila (strain ATCC 19061 / DSM 3370 / CCUG 14189 / LMG 1036 / NCIMB 9965 / AN6) TaxID=406817 RepID=D3VLG0_XENNA|nr:hypothetical protein XNC1_3234 [Xenorhabdus nematophila ATCC 19061]